MWNLLLVSNRWHEKLTRYVTNNKKQMNDLETITTCFFVILKENWPWRIDLEAMSTSPANVTVFIEYRDSFTKAVTKNVIVVVLSISINYINVGLIQTFHRHQVWRCFSNMRWCRRSVLIKLRPSAFKRVILEVLLQFWRESDSRVNHIHWCGYQSTTVVHSRVSRQRRCLLSISCKCV